MHEQIAMKGANTTRLDMTSRQTNVTIVEKSIVFISQFFGCGKTPSDVERKLTLHLE